MENFSISVPMSPAGVGLFRASLTYLESMVGNKSAAPAAVATAATAAAPAVLADGPAAAPVKGKPGRKSNAEKAAAAGQGATAAPADDLGLGDEGDELGLDDVAPAAPPAKKLTLNDDVIPAFRDALARVGGDKARLAAVLTEYGVKSVQLLPETKFAEVVTKLAKLK